MLPRRILTADVVYSGIGTPRRNGAVVIQGEGQDAQVIAIDHLAAATANHPDAPVEEAGFAISPPLVNAHTHLDLSDMPQFRGDYEAFITAVIAHTKAGKRGLGAAKRGVDELLAAGIGTIGDIVADEEVMEYLLKHPKLTGVAYWEVISLRDDQAEERFEQALGELRRFRRWERPGGMKLGLSLHTPHTVSPQLMQKLARLAQESRLPLQMHVAETAGEVELHSSGGGPLKALLANLGCDWRPSGLSPVQYLSRLGVLEARPTLVHMVHVSEEDIRLVQKAGCTVVHCPRSNEGLGCGRFPWELYARQGAEVAFGTDSRGSAPDLSIEAEVGHAAALHGERASSLALVRSAVKGGCRALGVEPPKVMRGDPASKLHIWPPLRELGRVH